MKKETLDRLYDEFEVSIQPGKNFKYIKTKDIVHRINTVFDGRWSTDVVSSEIVNGSVLLCLCLTVTDEDGRDFRQVGYGSARVFDKAEVSVAYQSAKSRAIKNAAKNWGAGLFIDDGQANSEYENSKPAANNYNGAKKAPMPGAVPPSSHVPSGPGPGPGPGPSVPSTPAGQPASKNFPGDMPPGSDSNDGGSDIGKMGIPGMSDTPFNSPGSGKMSDFATNEVPTGLPEMPQAGSESSTLTIIQRAAIETKVKKAGTTFEEFAKKFFEEKGMEGSPKSMDDLTYTQAQAIASYKI